MKKLVSSILPLILFFVLSGVAVAADASNPSIVELPDVKIIMDGKITKFTDVPIGIGQNTLLPLRELFLNLGVPEANILYNARERSVTVTKDHTRLYLEVGSRTAMWNGAPVRLGTAPVGYAKNQRIYIPFRFAAEALGKKVVWDGTSRAILVCDAYKFDMVKQILDRSNEAMSHLQKCGIAMDMSGTVKSGKAGKAGKAGMKLGMSMDSKIDRGNRTMYSETTLSMPGMSMDTNVYYVNNSSYTFNPLGGKWEKKTYLEAEYDKLFANQSNINILNANDSLCAGLVKADGDTANEIVLKGDVYLGGLFRKAMADRQGTDLLTAPENMDFSYFYTEMVIDNATSLLKSVSMHVIYDQTQKEGDRTTMEGSLAKKGGNPKKASAAGVDFKIQVSYSDYNGDFQITVPEETIQNAAEMKTSFIQNLFRPILLIR